MPSTPKKIPMSSTPKKRRHANAVQSTPTHFGRAWNAAQKIVQGEDSAAEVHDLAEKLDIQATFEEFKEFAASKDSNIKDWPDSKFLTAIRRVQRVAQFLVLNPPADCAADCAPATERVGCLKMIFAHDEMYHPPPPAASPFLSLTFRDIEVWATDTGRKLQEWLIKANAAKGPLARMTARLCALSAFSKENLNPPKNLVWLYLFMHQVLYGMVAKQHPQACGFKSGTKPQTIDEAVNKDLKNLLFSRGDFVPAMAKSTIRDNLKSYKVLSSCFSC